MTLSNGDYIYLPTKRALTVGPAEVTTLSIGVARVPVAPETFMLFNKTEFTLTVIKRVLYHLGTG